MPTYQATSIVTIKTTILKNHVHVANLTTSLNSVPGVRIGSRCRRPPRGRRRGSCGAGRRARRGPWCQSSGASGSARGSLRRRFIGTVENGYCDHVSSSELSVVTTIGYYDYFALRFFAWTQRGLLSPCDN